MPAKRKTAPTATIGALWPSPQPTVRIHAFTPVSFVSPVAAPPPLEEPPEAPAPAASPCPITLTLDVQSPAEELEPLSADLFPPELHTAEFAPTPPGPAEGRRSFEAVAPRAAPTVSTGEVLGPDPCEAEFVTFAGDPRRQTTIMPMRDVESMMFEEMMRRVQPRPKASSSWMLLGAGAGIGAGVTALLSMLTLPLLIGALRGASAPSSPPQVVAAAPTAAQPSTVILSGFVPAPTSPGVAAAQPARTTPAADPRRAYRDPPPGALPVVEEWSRGRPLPPELAQAAPSRAPAASAAEPRDHQPVKDADAARR